MRCKGYETNTLKSCRFGPGSHGVSKDQGAAGEIKGPFWDTSGFVRFGVFFFSPVDASSFRTRPGAET